jgi:DeoR/GlpR family transcriptional regulator of sugar metabolism
MNINQTVSFDQHLGEKHKLNLSEKTKIGKAAAKLICDSDTGIIDSGISEEDKKRLEDANIKVIIV